VLPHQSHPQRPHGGVAGSGNVGRVEFEGRVFLRCFSGCSIFEGDPWLFFCPRCGSLLDVVVEPPGSISRHLFELRSVRSIWRYRELLPVPVVLDW
jgi:hypothetical protein